MQTMTAPYTKYRETQIMTASPGELIIMLYDGAIKYASQAKIYLSGRDIEKANNSLLKAQDIIAELMGSLNLDVGKIAKDLYALYEYMLYKLTMANIKKDDKAVEEVIGLLSTLRSAWEQIVRGSVTAVRER